MHKLGFEGKKMVAWKLEEPKWELKDPPEAKVLVCKAQ